MCEIGKPCRSVTNSSMAARGDPAQISSIGSDPDVTFAAIVRRDSSCSIKNERRRRRRRDFCEDGQVRICFLDIWGPTIGLLSIKIEVMADCHAHKQFPAEKSLPPSEKPSISSMASVASPPGREPAYLSKASAFGQRRDRIGQGVRSEAVSQNLQVPVRRRDLNSFRKIDAHFGQAASTTDIADNEECFRDLCNPRNPRSKSSHR